jgi:hypothetical protein
MGNYYAGLVVDYNIVTGNNFISSQAYTSSDVRIKSIIGLSDNKQDLNNKHLQVTLAKNYALKVGDKIKLVHPTEGEILVEIESVYGNTFTVKNWLYNTQKIFVYGREVNDFRVVDYEALSMLGISAVQQLSKEIEELRKENKTLKTEIMARLEAMESRFVK